MMEHARENHVVRVLLTISNALGTLISNSEDPDKTREAIAPVWAQLLNGLRTPPLSEGTTLR